MRKIMESLNDKLHHYSKLQFLKHNSFKTSCSDQIYNRQLKTYELGTQSKINYIRMLSIPPADKNIAKYRECTKETVYVY